jgi:uncharacterized protein with von Willebrand factor type A (vWA) domain
VKNRLLDFVDQLRAAGIDASVAETIDAVAATGAVGIERELLRAVLAAALVKDHADRPTFDSVFDRFFAVSGRERGKGERPQPLGEGLGRGQGEPAESGKPTGEPQRRGRAVPPLDQREKKAVTRDQASAKRLARRREILVTPFEAMDPRMVEEAEELLEELSRRLRAHLRRRLRRAQRGRLDFRRTIRASLGSGGVPVLPEFRQRRRGKVDLVALCDLSHSTVTAADFLLALLAPAAHFFRRARLFGYVDHPVEISFERGHVVPHEPLDLAARSDFGRVLQQLWDGWESVISRNTLVMILGDARNNRRPPRADILARLHARARRVVWLNPETRARWNTGDSVMATYARHCDALIAAGTLRALSLALRSEL